MMEAALKDEDTLMSNDARYLLGPRNAVHSQTVVPVATEKQQLCIGRHGKQLRRRTNVRTTDSTRGSQSTTAPVPQVSK